MDTLTDDTAEALEEIGWTVTDESGNVIDFGTIAIAEMTTELIDQINQEEEVN